MSNLVQAQAELTDGLLAKIPGRDELTQEWLALDKLKPADYSAIRYENGRVFYKKTLGGENVGKLYSRQGWNGTEKLLFDPGTDKAGVTTTIQSIAPSWDGKYVAMGLSSRGAEWSEIRVLDVERGTLLPDSIYPSYGPQGWLKDNRSFLYDAGKTVDIKSLDIELNRKTKVHRLGTETATDVDIFSDESNPELGITAKEIPSASVDESYPRITWSETRNCPKRVAAFLFPVSDTEAQKIKWNVLCKRSDDVVRSLCSTGIMSTPSPMPVRQNTKLFGRT
jgi:prolyl oligopeptidase